MAPHIPPKMAHSSKNLRFTIKSQVGIVALRVAVINLDVWWTEGETRKNPPYWHNLNTIHMVVTYTIWDKSGQLSFFPSQFPSWIARFYLVNLLKSEIWQLQHGYSLSINNLHLIHLLGDFSLYCRKKLIAKQKICFLHESKAYKVFLIKNY